MPRLAKSLEVLRSEVDSMAPHRGKSSDGWIGDASHAAHASRHNPNNAGVVCALDITHDPVHGMDTYVLFDRLRLHPHPDCEYLISNRRIARRDRGWIVGAYTGTSPHTEHIHIAVGRGPDSEPTPPYDDTMPWGVVAPVPPQPGDEDVTREEHEMITFGAMFALEGKLDANIAKAYAKGDVNGAHVLETKRAPTIAYWRGRWGLDAIEKTAGVIGDG